MNKVILMGRLVRDPEIITAGETTIARYTLAVNRRFKKDGQQEADFINCVAIGKNGEFVEKFFKKGQMVSIAGRLQVRSWDDKEGTRRWSTAVITEEHYFTGGKKQEGTTESQPVEGFYPVDANGVEDDDLPF